MKNVLLLFAISIMLSSVTYASFPVTQSTNEVVVVTNAESTTNAEPIVSGNSFNWQAIVSLACSQLAWSVSWLFAIPGVVFGFMAVKGDKSIKWLGWIAYILNAVFLGVGVGMLLSA